MTPGPTKKIRIGEVLVEDGLLARKDLARVLAEQQSTGRFLGEMLVEKGLVTGEKLLRALERRLGIRGCRLRSGMVDPSLLDLIGEEEALRLKALPMFKVRDTLTVAMAEPQSLPHIDRLRQLTGCHIRPVLALEGQIVEWVKNCSGPAEGFHDFVASLADADVQVVEETEDDSLAVTDLDKAVQGDSPVVNLVNLVLLRAVKDGASDIHIEPEKKATRVRYRIDGVLRDLMRPPLGMHAAIVSRVKVTGRMDIAEKRLPQEGRVRISAEGREIDLRISSMPTVLGEKIVIRILDKANLQVRLEDLGFRPGPQEGFVRMLRRPYGLVLVTGPTGSGKTTTLYSALSLLRSPERNIVTVEDPVEYQLDLVNQIQVQESINMTFVRALRGILRQDPDVIMIGEIRDEETARVGVQAALTGHLVLATLHTNDAAGAMARLVDMGIEPYLLSGALNGVVAQRLLRTVCPHCMEAYTPEADVLAQSGLAEGQARSFTRGAGCTNCHESGFTGRTGIYEVMELSPTLRPLVRKALSPQEIREQWQKEGGRTLRQEGVFVALEGKTSLEEALSVTYGEGESLPESAGRQLTRQEESVAAG
jgi:type IV pilus assembly protein PilB